MAITITPRALPKQSTGSLLGEALGTGLSRGIERLAEQKIAQLSQQQQAQQFEQAGLPGILAQLQGPSQAAYLKEALRAPQAQAYGDALRAILGGGAVGSPQLPENIGAGLTPEMFSSLVNTAFQKQAAESKAQRESQRGELEEKKYYRELNKPFVESQRKQYEPARKINDLVRSAIDIVERGDPTLGPVAGRIPAISGTNQELDQLLNEILLQKSQLEQLGGRASKLYLTLQKEAKPSRALRKDVLLKRLNMLKKEASRQLDSNRLLDEIYAAGLPNTEQVFKNVEKIYPRLGNASEYEEGTQIKAGRYLFEAGDGEWHFIGESQ